MLKSSQAVLLYHFPYGDNSRIVKLFTPEDGLISGFLRMSKKHNRAGLLQPLSLLDIVYWRAPQKEMVTLREIRLDVGYTTIGQDIYRTTVVLFLNEILNKVIREGADDTTLFSFIREWLVHYDTAVFDPDEHLFFLAHLSGLCGYLPNGCFTTETPYFDLEAGAFVSRFPGHPRFLEKGDAEGFEALFNGQQNRSFSYEQRKVLLHALMEYFRLHFPDFREIRSLPIVEDLFRP